MAATGLELDGRRILVTGAGSGIGAAIAAHAAAAGAAVAVNDLEPDRAEETRKRIAGAGGATSERVTVVAGDVSQPASATAVVARAADALGGLDGLVNNVGIVRPGMLETVSLDDWDITFRVDVTAAFLCGRAALPWLRERGGAIVNISSLVAAFAAPGSGAYSAAKAAVVGLTQQMALEWARHGIRVNAIGPGLISGTRFASSGDPAVQARRQHVAPLGRTGTSDDIAPVAVFLLSEGAGYVTGQFLHVDGGLGIAVQTFIPA
jgi:NAD(P)-dependent dehydrogenase (short-subunit alcohol dehydrogenase family)